MPAQHLGYSSAAATVIGLARVTSADTNAEVVMATANVHEDHGPEECPGDLDHRRADAALSGERDTKGGGCDNAEAGKPSWMPVFMAWAPATPYWRSPARKTRPLR